MTRVGELTFAVPQVRNGGFYLSGVNYPERSTTIILSGAVRR